uniref:Uncharacterized protein n=1 Tax=Glossina austeni TaxID=7395 RepID=A0A1A9UD83_GLOAU
MIILKSKILSVHNTFRKIHKSSTLKYFPCLMLLQLVSKQAPIMTVVHIILVYSTNEAMEAIFVSNLFITLCIARILKQTKEKGKQNTTFRQIIKN